jgi:CheY-like chemotaxis protein
MTDEAAGGYILLLSDDLLFPSRVREALRGGPYSLRTVGTLAALNAALTPSLPMAILVNLAARRYDPLEALQQLKTGGATRAVPILAFAGHIETAKHEAARAAGADLVAANSSVSLHLPALLKRLLNLDPSAEGERALVELDEAAA